MFGAIRKRDILAHPFCTIRCFGWEVFFRALVAGRRQTFLSILVEARALGARAIEARAVGTPELIERCIALENRAKSIYERLAQRFAHSATARGFFSDLARQEQSHAELLELCRRAAGREGWREEPFSQVRDWAPRLESGMADIESSLESVADLTEALRLVIRIEGAEVNEAFRSVVTATDSAFVSKVSAFQTAGARHIAFICEEIPRIDPGRAQECRRLRDRAP